MAEEAAARWDGADVLLVVKGRPGARREGIAGVEGGAVRVAVRVAAEQGKATARLLALLAGLFGVPRRQVVLLAGEFSPVKRVRIESPAKIPPELISLLDQQRPKTV